MYALSRKPRFPDSAGIAHNRRSLARLFKPFLSMQTPDSALCR